MHVLSPKHGAERDADAAAVGVPAGGSLRTGARPSVQSANYSGLEAGGAGATAAAITCSTVQPSQAASFTAVS